MGIDGLLTLLKPIVSKEHISSFRNKTLAIDALPWIYKGIYGANIQLNGQINHQNQHLFLYYINEMIDMLQFYHIKPLFVFDGRSLTAKAKTLEKRKKARQENQKKADQLAQKNQQQKAKKTLARLIVVDEHKLCGVMSLLQKRKVQFVVAPYEADSQICKLYKLGKIQAVITQDSDLVIYGVDVILKLKQTGQCDFLSLKIDEEEVEKIDCPFIKKFLKFSPQKRIQSAILAGCDYVESVKGIGMKKAIKLVDQNDTLQKIVEALKKDPKLGTKVLEDYLQLITTAKLIFFLARTFNPLQNRLEYLNTSIQDILVNETKNLSKQQIDQIVGPQYEFTKQTYDGNMHCKTNEKREFNKIDINKIYAFHLQCVNFDAKSSRSAVQLKSDKKIKECIIDQTTSICWETDSMDEGLAFLLQKELIERFFSNNNIVENENEKLQSSEPK